MPLSWYGKLAFCLCWSEVTGLPMTRPGSRGSPSTLSSNSHLESVQSNRERDGSVVEHYGPSELSPLNTEEPTSVIARRLNSCPPHEKNRENIGSPCQAAEYRSKLRIWRRMTTHREHRAIECYQRYVALRIVLKTYTMYWRTNRSL